MNIDIELPCISDSRGRLIFAEAERHIPFQIKRLYFVTGTKANKPRGFHAHKKLHQAAFCVQGSCRLLLDSGTQKHWTTLSSPSQVALIGPLTWREMHDFTEDCILVVLADDYYDESDYIRDYDEFIALVR